MSARGLMNDFFSRLFGRDGHRYAHLGGENAPAEFKAALWTRKHSILLIILVAFAGLAAIYVSSSNESPATYDKGKSCDTVEHGYQCNAGISHFWDQLTTFGEQQLVNSGIKYYERYKELSRDFVPFVRSSGQERVVESALNWTQGFTAAKLADKHASQDPEAYPRLDVTIPEADYGVNNTLNHDLCTEFENGTYSTIADDAQFAWAEIFATPIQKRLNAHLLGAQLSIDETITMMALCPFNVVASPTGKTSPFCALFTEEQWYQYGYYESLGKWYGYSHGNPLGPTQGVGFANELIARMVDKPVDDHTSTNRTLDKSSETFPLGRKLYADFSHDNDLTAIFSALGLYNGTSNLPTSNIVEAQNANGYSAAWTVPFAARAYFEKMICNEHDDELVRVIINDRVLPLEQCGGDGFGRCTLTSFVDSLGFVNGGGRWDQCFV
ncbi:hypothetical protein LTR37_004284 [Vermiconidia calcicola]|uniref:Uncharacterized protein n=1 Tax=Vermiconidia calcicola TaxID=1690605 RepID=A0ACC3NMC8_9PEZI|nr:hypothetical protein LTR37_004284 [Vermiconidia calcicola]